MISIRKTSEEMDRLDELVHAAKASYALAVQSAAEYTVELDAADGEIFRERLERIRAQVGGVAAPEDWTPIQSSFRGELRDHGGRSKARLDKLHAELQSAAEAMRVFAEDVASTGTDHEQEVREAVRELDAAAKQESLEGIRSALAKTSARLVTSIERMRRAHQLSIAQLRDEIRMLHRKLDAEKRIRFVDAATGVWNRHKLDAKLDELLQAQESFCVLVVSIRNLKRLDQLYPPALVQSGVKALAQRFSAMAGGEALVGRWGEETFAAIVQCEPGEAIALSREAARRLSDPYPVQDNGVSRAIALRAATGIIDCTPGPNARDFRQKLLRMSAALQSA